MKLKCPKCKREWAPETEQAISVELYSECMVCRFIPKSPTTREKGTAAELEEILTIWRVRNNEAASASLPLEQS